MFSFQGICPKAIPAVDLGLATGRGELSISILLMFLLNVTNGVYFLFSQQKLIIRNQSKTPTKILQLQLSIQGNHSDFQVYCEIFNFFVI